MLVCRQTADEMRALPFELNSATFTTSNTNTDHFSDRARLFDKVLERLYIAKSRSFSRVGPFVTDDIEQQLIAKYPKSATIIRHLRNMDQEERNK